MSTKTFKSSSGTGRTVEIEPNSGSVNMVIYKGPSRANKYLGINIAPADAPALALAILEAAGVEPVPFDECPETEAGHAAWVLRHHVQESEAKAKEAADREERERARMVLQCRRNNLAIDLIGHPEAFYAPCTAALQQAIDRIIELEDKAKS